VTVVACLTLVVVAALALGVLAGEARAEFCANMNQELLRADAAPVPGSTTFAVISGVLQTTQRLVMGTAAVHPVARTVRITATIYPATDPGEFSFLNFSVSLDSGAGTGTFAKVSGLVGQLSFQVVPCP
jgi:hypothetical protein